MPVARLVQIAEEQTQAAQLANEMQAAQIEKAKQPPPKPVIVAPGQQPPQHSSQSPSKAANNLPEDDKPQKEEGFETDWLLEAETVPTSAEELAKSIDDLFSKIARRGNVALDDEEDE